MFYPGKELVVNFAAAALTVIYPYFLFIILREMTYASYGASPIRWYNYLSRSLWLGGGPLFWYGRLIGALSNLPSNVVTYFVRRSSWSVLVTIAMGLEGYGFELPRIDQRPHYMYDDLVIYENMPIGAEQRAMNRRSAWIERHLGDVAETFSKLAVTAADLSALLQVVEQDQSLVHAAYYTDDECIGRIADWIAEIRRP
jgi:hypothetical protein